MKLLLFLSGILWVMPPVRSEASETPLVLHYYLASEGTIDIRGDDLRWDRFPNASSPAEVRHTKLNITNNVWLFRWLDRHRVMTMPEDFPTASKPEADLGSLAVRLGEARRTIAWQPGCDCRELLAAISELKAFAAVVAPRPATPSGPVESIAPVESIVVPSDISKPARGIPFRNVVQSTTQHRLLEFDPRNEQHVKLRELIRMAADTAGKRAVAEGMFAARANEAGNHLEPLVKSALRALKLDARTPVNTSGDSQGSGYPDLEISGPTSCYLELKTYNASTANTTQRTFYYSPSSHPKITRDALHLLLAFEMKKVERGGKTAFVPAHWKLITLQDLSVDLKFEFNQGNRGVYGAGAASAVLAENKIAE